MRSVNRRFTFLAIFGLLAAALAACGGGAATTGPAGTGTGSVEVTAGGATFPYPLYSRWFYDYAFVNPAPKFNYQAIGSGGGIKGITEKTLDFAGSDAILNADQRAAAPDVLMFPTVAGAVVIAYNVVDADGNAITANLQLTPDAIVGIFMGNITKWNDPALTELNPNVKLPDADIVVAHRSDGSGTTFAFTSYLSAVSADWKNSVGAGTSVEFPVGLGGRGNAGVAGIVKDQPDSIGYLDLADALSNNLPVAAVKNSAGNFVVPSVESVQAAMTSMIDQMPEDMGLLLVNAPGGDAYPIASFTFLLLHKDMPDCVKAGQILAWYRWALSEGDQAAIGLNYAPLADAVKQKVMDRLATLTCEGGKAIPDVSK